MNEKLRQFGRIIGKHKVSIIWTMAICCFILSFIQTSSSSSGKRAAKVERLLHKREKVLQSYVDRAFDTPAEEWLRFESFPEDMVLYRYVEDTLQSWINNFPISNDDLKIPSQWYRINDLRNKNKFNIPLAFLRDSVQYVNLGPKWYVVKVYDRGKMHIVAAIEISEQYEAENSVLKNTCNRRIGLSDKYLTLPPYINDINIVHTSDGTPSFSVIRKDLLKHGNSYSGLKWLALLLAVIAILSYQNGKRSVKTLYFGIGGLAVLHICTFMMIKDIPASIEFFSPMLYADRNFGSFGALMICHAFIFLYCTNLFMCRKSVVRDIRTSASLPGKLKTAALGLSAVLLAAYIHMTFRSLILNSGINYDLYRINEISVYSIIAYLMYSLLALSLLFITNIFISVAGKNCIAGRKRHSKKLILTYILITALYMTGAVSYYGFKKECENLRVLTGRLAVERDLALEIQLQTIEKSIISDPLIRRMTGIPEYENIILNRLYERYFFNLLQEYDIRLTICNAHQVIRTDDYSSPVPCFRHFKDIIDNYGIPLSDMSAFYYLDYFRNNISYIGAFSIFRNGMRYDMYIEIESRTSADNTGYPSILLDKTAMASSAVRLPYSMAKYHKGRLTSHQGRYNFPVSVNIYSYDDGFSYHFIKDNVIFVNKLPGTNMIAISRPSRGLFQSLISFSYLFLLFALVIIGLPRLFRKKNREMLFRPKRSFRLKMTVFLTASMVIALVLMAIGSIVIIMGYINNDSTALMEEKIKSVSETLTNISKTSGVYNEYNCNEVFNAMSDISRSTQADINLYDPYGRLLLTTRPEIFNEYLSGTRINPDAYYELVFMKRMQIIRKESISDISYFSLYTPIYNEKGTLIAIANIPYFTTDTNFEYDASPVIAAIINLYLILIIAALLIGITMSNSITKPLKEISRNMLEMDITHKAEHINYRADDELGMLVKTYNKMIDDLDRSTKELAQSEREQAWREMARQIAHEIKNPLTPMKLSIQHLIRLKKQGIPDWQDRFDTLASSLIEQIDILSNTASEFSSFAKFYNEEATEVNLVEILSEQEALFNNVDNIRMTFTSNLEKAVVFARKGQITRAFVNLITNAIQAVESQESGIISITLGTVPGYYRIDVEDNGSGVSEENLEKLFRPNFTTKTRGSGLGLAICKNIITQSHGEISYSKSEKLGGADFSVMLPVHTTASEDNT